MTALLDEATPTTREVAQRLHARGWSPLPLPPRAKSEPPRGFTGYAGKYATAADVDAWEWSGNIAIRLPPGVVGVDTDVYKGGDAGLAELEVKYGKLPPTIWSTSREDGSGIALFQVPVGTTLATDPATGVDMIQPHHRYMVVWPSIHPEGRVYQWIDEQSGEYVDEPPEAYELPQLPWGWIEGLAVAKSEAAAAATPDEAREFLATCIRRTQPTAIKGIRTRLAGYTSARHDTLVEIACWALREAAAGLVTADEVIAELYSWWRRVMDDPVRRDGGEFGAAIMWAVAQVRNEPERIAEIANRPTPNTPTPPPNVDPTTGEILPTRNLSDDFWQSRAVLEHIRQAAHHRARSADAVLLNVLARVAALTPPSVTLPAVVGSRASLNFLGGVISSSGGGKSTAVDLAAELLPINRKDVVDLPMGSGEGLIESFFEWVTEEDENGKSRKAKKQTKSASMIYLDEGQALAEMGGRKGATLLPTLRSAWSGTMIGQANASQDTHRVLRAHKYRMAIIVGFQLEYAAGLIDDAPGGTPQRFVFASAVDPSIPDDPPPWPGQLTLDTPAITPAGTEIELADSVATEIRQRSLLAARGQYIPDPLDSHRDLVRLKVAALLALLESSTHVDVADWELAGEIMTTSSFVRSWVIEHARNKAELAEVGRTAVLVRRQAALEDDATRRALLAGARAIGRRVHRDGGREVLTRRDIHAAVKSKDRALVELDDMLAYAIDQKWIVAVNDGWQTGESRPA